MIDTLDKVSVMFTNFIQQDSEAFDQVMLAFKMPKETETEKLIRNQAIQQGFLNASRSEEHTSELQSPSF